jgi:omega-6 fatty acid desaturase (delta-12 desaturase)
MNTPTPATVDAALSANPLSLPTIRRAIPRDCFALSAPRAWGALLRVVVSAGACLFLLSRVQPHPATDPLALVWQVPLLLVLWVMYGWVLVGAFTIGHDCGHRTFSRRGWVNTLVGHLCMTPLANSFHVWRLTHGHHHAHTNLRGQDVDWAAFLMTREEFESRGKAVPLIVRLGYALPFGIALWVTWNALRRGFALDAMLTPAQRVEERARIRWSNAILLAVLLVIYGGLWYAAGFWGMIKYHGIPALVAMFTGWLHITIQHANEASVLYEAPAWTPAKGQMVSTFDVRFPRVLEYLWFRINIHIPHHVSTGIPWYNLDRAAEALEHAYPDLYQKEAFTPRHLSWFYRTPFLRRVDDRGYFAMDVTARAEAAAA